LNQRTGADQGSSGRTEGLSRKIHDRVIVVYVLLAAPVVATVLFWGSWIWLAATAVVAVVEYAMLRRSQRFSARLWRSIRVGHRSSHERAAESIYVVSAVAGVVLLAVAVIAAIR
jgi:hypothetical protein